jgi:site-specific recombinase XerD
MGSSLIQYKNTTQLTKVINWKAFAKENPEYKIEVSKDCEYWFEQNEIAAGDDIADYYLKNHNLNIFTGRTQPYNRSYFSTLWKRFKKVNLSLEQDITIYSFRHSGAIEIFKRTGSLTKLQKAMGHSSLNVSLTYLRGLEVAELTESDMPMV